MSGKAGNNAGASYVHFSTGHEDLVHDVAYGTSFNPHRRASIPNTAIDYYGRRMATVSSDQRLKIFDLNDDGEWVASDSFKAHDASINRVRPARAACRRCLMRCE